jgi:hypothetical protein
MLQSPGVYLLIIASVLLLFRMLAVQSRSGVLLVVALGGLAGGLVAQSSRRPVGDSHQYVAMASAFAHGAAPARSEDQHVRRSWLYPLAAAPFVRAAEAAGRDPLIGFTALNVVLLIVAGVLLVRRVSVVAAVLLAAGPILWWVDKAHTEVFTFSLITLAIVLLTTAPWWSILALGAAAAQNPPIAGAMLAAILFAWVTFGFQDRRVWIAAAAGLVLAALSPLYHFVLGDGALGQAYDIDLHWPLARELLTTSLDPNVGILIHNPFLTAAVVIALFLALIRAPRQLFTSAHACVLVIGALFVLISTQTMNVNSGGTPGPSRYGLWLLPIAIPALAAAPPTTALRIAAAASLVWSAIFFAPKLPENHLRPTALARTLWQRWPAVDNPLVEVFSERVSGSEPAPGPPLATPGCEKVLIAGAGEGNDARWPARCTPATAPPFCREVDVLCYANRSGEAYGFTRLPVPASWTRERFSQPAGLGTTERPDPLVVAPGASGAAIAAAWMDAGWSYLEEVKADEVRWRWMGDQAEIGVIAREPVDVRLRIDMRAHARPRRIRISAGNADIATWIVTTSRSVYETAPFRLPPGPVHVRFDSADGADPADSGDPRLLSVAVFGLRVLVGK